MRRQGDPPKLSLDSPNRDTVAGEAPSRHLSNGSWMITALASREVSSFVAGTAFFVQ
jgi:hypothetical protein